MQCITVLLTLVAVMLVVGATAQNRDVKWVDAARFLTGKIAPTPQPYHRVDTARYDFTPAENRLVRNSVGLTVLFSTDSRSISLRTAYVATPHRPNLSDISTAGYDLYIKRDGEWLFADAGVHKNLDGSIPLELVANMDGSVKECLINLPMFSELSSLEIGIDAEATIEAVSNPFRHKIVYFGSSYTHGGCVSRPGMNYPTQLSRLTGLNIVNLGVSGNSVLQPSFARVLADSDADAFMFDAFSNPSAQTIEERLLPFIALIRASHPHTPMIFVQTIHREDSNFDLVRAGREEQRFDMVKRMMKQAMKQFDDVYFIDVEMTGTDHETSADGDHPSDLGHYRWAHAIQPKVVKILAKYGIR